VGLPLVDGHLKRLNGDMLQTDYKNLFPYLNDYVSFRFSEEKVQLRNLKKRVETIIDLNGSAYPFVRELNGLISVNEIFTKLSAYFQGVSSEIIQQDYSDIMEQLLKEDLISLSEKPVEKSRRGVEIVASEIRSSIHFDITHRCNERCIHCLVDKEIGRAHV
jgi:hypothetical protein